MIKRTTLLQRGGLILALDLAGLGCGGGLSSPPAHGEAPAAPAGTGTLSVHLVPDGVAGTLSHLNLAFTALELRVDGVWRPVPLAAQGQPLDLLAAVPASLAAQVPWPTGANDAMRFSLGPGSTIQFAADDPETFHPLAVPRSFVSTMGLPGSFSVGDQSGADLWIAFSVADVVLPDPADPNGYLFSPGAVRGYDKAATGSISGLLTAAGDPAAAPVPLPGAAVTAQLQRGAGAPGAAIAFRTVLTDAEGRYSLDLLPLGPGYSWCVVSQPAVGGAGYFAQASRGFLLGTGQSSLAAADLAFTPAAIPGSVAGTVAAATGVGGEDTVDLVQELTVGGVPCAFVLGSAPLAPAADGSYSFSFPTVPPGIYSAVLNDYSRSDLLGRLDQARGTAPFAVSAGARTVLKF